MSASDEAPSLTEPIVLLLSAILGFLISNSPLAETYQHLLHTPIQIVIGHMSLLDKSLLHLINDGLMVIFFLFVGLELKREIIVGELSDIRKAMLPIFGAAGGMIVPALVYFAFNPSGPESAGWGIPMATDIAFAMGILAVLGSRVPTALKILLTAIAIVDDLGAILVIAMFYTSELNLGALSLAFGLLAFAFALNQAGVMKTSVYVAIGIPIWYFMLKSGIHATIAGVLLAAVIPLAKKGQSTATVIADIFQKKASPLDSPAVFLEKSLAKWVGIVIIPIFAFSNSGVPLQSLEFGSIGLGVSLGLLVGKPVGITLAAFLAKKLNLANLPKGVSWEQVIGLGFLAGVGFTMSLFISSLAFTNEAFNDQAKLAIILGSLTAAFIGTITLLKASNRSTKAKSSTT
ncbi:MAG: Na+/H+ antiporter NhaA [Zetaproteobacteria bacterium]|nr:Na+/H+ antiporter NhaA [Zetaproteobacteria bacterium]